MGLSVASCYRNRDKLLSSCATLPLPTFYCYLCYLLFFIIIIICLFFQVAEYFEKARKLEGRVASDEDLKTSDLLRYYVRDTEAAKILLYRGARCLADYEIANKALDKARVKGKEVTAVSRMLLLD